MPLAPPLPIDGVGYTQPISKEGMQSSVTLGKMLRGRLRTLQSSPLTRCIQTAEGIRQGAHMDLPIVHNHLLGDPGIFVQDAEMAWENWIRLGNEGVIRHLMFANENLPGMAAADSAAKTLISELFAVGGKVPGVHAFVTHDALLAPTAARLLRLPSNSSPLPNFLESAFFWHDQQGTHVSYREHHEYGVLLASPPHCR